jgi:hypothetical protein
MREKCREEHLNQGGIIVKRILKNLKRASPFVPVLNIYGVIIRRKM